MKIKDLPVGTKYRQKENDMFDADTESVYIVVSLTAFQDVIDAPNMGEGVSYCLDTNELVPWRGHQNWEAIVVE